MNPDVLSAIGSISSAVVAAFAFIISIFAWRASRNSAKATESLTRIERMRLHGEMLPQVEARIEMLLAGAGNRYAVMNLRLLGPQMLVQLDSLTIEFRSVHLVMKSDRTGTYFTKSEWPLWIVEDPENSALSTKKVIEGPIFIGEDKAVIVTTSPESQGGLNNFNFVVPASLTCTRAGFEPWTVPLTVSWVGDDEATS